MKFTKIGLLSLIIIFILAACGSAPVEQELGSPNVENSSSNIAVTPIATETPAPPPAQGTSLDFSYENALSTRLGLALGILKLEESDVPITTQQAPDLLMLWQGLVNLTNSGTSAEAEVNALLSQIEKTLSPEQIQMINQMKLTQTDTQAWALENGLTIGTGTGTGMGQGQGSNLTAEEKATRQAANNPTGDTSTRENSLSNVLTQALIDYLENKSK